MSLRSTPAAASSVGVLRSAPRITPAEEALSAIVSASLIRQSVIRLSISSRLGTMYAVAASTSASVQPAPGRADPST